MLPSQVSLSRSLTCATENFGKRLRPTVSVEETFQWRVFIGLPGRLCTTPASLQDHLHHGLSLLVYLGSKPILQLAQAPNNRFHGLRSASVASRSASSRSNRSMKHRICGPWIYTSSWTAATEADRALPWYSHSCWDKSSPRGAQGVAAFARRSRPHR